ncbi:CHASE2 domain-containing protein [Candidatus Parabeggiatoa sp. HSG14]|uniref:CHASE2 domain-containing protein n=1 Tax=Candidatus Parabeggiatoa sp. HSG14 TaxID=3055593 RepID=UPI0025A8AE70|nr:CHASE2 domain-containing protein [Thiotrichales bacterium HSG14]
MQNSEWQTKLTSIFYALLIAVGVTVLSFFEAFALLDEWAYDIFERWNPNQQVYDRVLLVEAPSETHDQGDDTWLTVLNTLQDKKAKQVVFTFMPKAVSDNFYCRAKQYGNVFFARSLQNDAQKLEPLPKTSCEINFGIVDIPPHTHGIHRKQYKNFQIEKQTYPALETIAAQQFLGKEILKSSPVQNDWLYRVHFGTGFDEFPRFQLERIISGGLVKELVEQRSVIIGFSHPHNAPGLHTPLAMTHDISISMLEYHALALNTLLSEHQITIFDKEIEFIVLLLLIVINFFIYQWLTIHQTLRFTLITICCYIILAWLLYHYVDLWFPLIEILIAQSLIYLFDFQNKSISSDRLLRETLVDNSFKLEDRINSESFASDEYWSQVVVILHEILNLNRLIILEAKPRYSRVKEVKALHCAITDIAQKQPRYNRKPYTTAIKKKKILHLKQTLLKTTDADEEQYLIPLFFKEDLQGFWALAIDAKQLTSKKYFIENIKDFANHLGESLYHRQQWFLRTKAEKAFLNRYFRLEGSRFVAKALDKSIAALEERLSILENIMDELETPMVIYNMFGIAIQVNQSMNALSNTFGLKPQQMSALGFLMEITHKDMKTSQQYFRHILLDGGKIVQQVTLSAAIERVYILNMQLFFCKEEIDGVQVDVKEGILCQLIDVTQMKLQSTLKEQVAERLIFQFRNDMQSILTASKLLVNEKASEAEKRMVGGILEKKVNEHLKILNEVEKQLSVEVDATTTTSSFEVYPVDAKEPMLKAMESLAKNAIEQQVKFQSHLPDLVSLVFAAPNELTLVITNLLTLLINDAVENTKLIIDMVERNNEIIYTFKNIGFGIPNERLQSYLFSKEVEVPEKFKDMHHIIKLLKIWGGTLIAESEVGQGMFFELRLRSFI